MMPFETMASGMIHTVVYITAIAWWFMDRGTIEGLTQSNVMTWENGELSNDLSFTVDHMISCSLPVVTRIVHMLHND